MRKKVLSEIEILWELINIRKDLNRAIKRCERVESSSIRVLGAFSKFPDKVGILRLGCLKFIEYLEKLEMYVMEHLKEERR